MTPSSSVPSVGVPMTIEALGSNWIKVYRPRQHEQWWGGAIGIGFGLMGLSPLRSASNWLLGGPMPDDRTLAGLICLLLFPYGILAIFDGLRGLPRLTVTPEGIRFDSSVGARWANWNSLGAFEVTTTYVGRYNQPVISGTAKIVGANASRIPLRLQSFSVPDKFQLPISTIVDELNADRALALSALASLLASHDGAE